MTEYEKQKKEDTKNPVANTIAKNNPIPNQKYPKVHFLNPEITSLKYISVQE
jgi:hypothetical protein